jgi:lactoylglutathione lyase
VEVTVFQELFPILSTPDLPGAVRFYRDLLGCEVVYRFPADGEPVYVGLALGASRLGIGADPPGEPRRPASGSRFALWVYAVDCDAAVERLRAQGVAVLAEPADQPWGERMAEVADPDGNRVIVAARG